MMIIETGTLAAAQAIVPMLIASLEREFGGASVDHLMAQFLDAEAADFHWEARLFEQHLGTYQSLDEEDAELDRIAILSHLAGCWHVGIAVVDGDGRIWDLHGLQSFSALGDAERAFATQH
jgi:hypothetical protein